MMGGSKRIMEMFLMKKSKEIKISTARFANVAFSDGSLLHGFDQRIKKMQPIAAPSDIRRYFVIPEESGELCLMSTIFGENRDIYFPKLEENLHLISFADIAKRYLDSLGYTPHLCKDEDEARSEVTKLVSEKKWPCLFSESNTTGEKSYEEFYTENETLNMETYNKLGVIKNQPSFDDEKLTHFLDTISKMRTRKKWNKEEIVALFHHMIPNFGHVEANKFLDSKM